MGSSVTGRRVSADPFAVDDAACTVLHVDMDAFFALVELRRHPELLGRPMMVAGTGPRSVVLSATYQARSTGIRSGMPTPVARRLCPGIAIVPPEHGLYSEVSGQVMAMFADVTPEVEPLSVDEAFLDVSGARRSRGRPAKIAVALRKRIADELGLVATIGAASTKFVAKLCSTIAKPDGLLIVPPAEVQDLLDPMPVRALWGVGPTLEKTLHGLGLQTVGEIARTEKRWLTRHLGEATGRRLHELSRGVDERPVLSHTTEASIGAETTFDSDTADRTLLKREVLALSDRTARRARAAGVRGRTVSIKVRYDDFHTVTRALTLAEPVDLARDINAAALVLFDRVQQDRLIRLIGVRLEKLDEPATQAEQLSFDVIADPPADVRRQSGGDRPDRRDADWRTAETTIDEVAGRFGAAALRPASLLGVAAPRHDRTRKPRPEPGAQA